MKSEKLKQVSLLGRIAYAIMCAEKVAVEKYPNKDWKTVFEAFWKACNCEALDVWSWEVMEYIPKYLFEFNDYESADFEYIDKDKYLKLVEIYKGVDDSLNQILLAIRNIEEEYAYLSIPEYGKISLEYIDEILAILEKNNIHLELIDDDTLNEEHLLDLSAKYKPELVLIEYNGMWELDKIFNIRVPKGWTVVQVLSFVNAQTFDVYVNNMKNAPNHFFFLLNTLTLNKLHRLTRGERRKVLSHISSTR